MTSGAGSSTPIRITMFLVPSLLLVAGCGEEADDSRSCQSETCNGIDDDCDGQTDEDFDANQSCLAGVGACVAAGMKICNVDGTGTVCDGTPGAPEAETCNGIDDDCDGSTDEDFSVGEACQVGEGACVADGTFVCGSDGRSVLCDATAGTPGEETCNYTDDDCDGAVDEEFAVDEVCHVGVGECAVQGTNECLEDGTDVFCPVDPNEPTDELCNGLDDDCDGMTDEDFAIGEECQVGEGECIGSGVMSCSEDGTDVFCDAQEGTGGEEVCNGLDDDCDGATDEGFGVGEECSSEGMGQCRNTGVYECEDGESVCNAVESEPTQETCDGLDNDCDGDTDEGMCRVSLSAPESIDFGDVPPNAYVEERVRLSNSGDTASGRIVLYIEAEVVDQFGYAACFSTEDAFFSSVRAGSSQSTTVVALRRNDNPGCTGNQTATLHFRNGSTNADLASTTLNAFFR